MGTYGNLIIREINCENLDITLVLHLGDTVRPVRRKQTSRPCAAIAYALNFTLFDFKGTGYEEIPCNGGVQCYLKYEMMLTYLSCTITYP